MSQIISRQPVNSRSRSNAGSVLPFSVLTVLLVAAACVDWPNLGGQTQEPATTSKEPAGKAAASEPTPKPALKTLTSKALPKAPALKQLEVGQEIATAAGERRLVRLPGGALLYVNEKTNVKLEKAQQLALAAGEFFLDNIPAPSKMKPANLIVDTPGGTTLTLNGGCSIQARDAGFGILVARGTAKINGMEKPLVAGQQLEPGAKKPVGAPRPSHLLGWTQELMAAAEAPLVPGSEFAGGALVAIDPNGQETKLSLRKYHIDVHIEDGFARTTIDQTYFNHENTDLESTFYFPLPADASLSRLAMYVDGKLMEGGMVERQYGAEVYDQIKYLKKDPALLEWVDGSTFKMRVFPVEARKEKRIILSYTQKLNSLYGRAEYRFPAGHSLPAVQWWSLNLRLKGGADYKWSSPSHTLKAAKEKGDLLLTADAKNALFNKDVVLLADDPALTNNAAKKVKFALAEHEGHPYLMVKLRPDLLREEEGAKPQAAKNWLFLFESSGDRDPLLARVQIEIIRNLLLQAQPGDTFNVLAANTKVRAFNKEPQPISAEAIGSAIGFLEGSHLIGALDLGQALTQAAEHLEDQPNSFLVHCGTGIAAMGEKRGDALRKLLPKDTRYVGVGVGKRWDRAFMKTTAEKTGGYFTQINPDESIVWRSFELASTLQNLGPAGLRQVTLTPITPARDEPLVMLHFNQLLAQGEELCAVTRLNVGENLPKKFTLHFGDGKNVEIPLGEVKKGADYLPRMWAKLEIDRLLATDPAKNKKDIIALSKAMYVMSPFTSLLVLENEDMYKQFGVDKGRKDHWAMYPAPEQILVVYEADADLPMKPKGAKTAKQVLQTIAGVKIAKKKTAIVDALDSLTVKGGDPAALEASIDLGFKVDRESLVNVPGMLNADAPIGIEGKPMKSPPISLAGATNSGKGFVDLNEYNLGLPLKMPEGAAPKIPILGDVSAVNALLKNNSYQYTMPPGGLGGFPSGGSTEAPPINLAVPLGYGGPGQGGGLDIVTESKIAQMWALEEHREPFHVGTIIEGNKVTKDKVIRRLLSFSSTEKDTLFYNLLEYAPGMHSTSADILGVLEAEAFFPHPAKQGKIDAGAQKLFDAARKVGWQQLTLQQKNGKPGAVIYFDGQGRFAYEQTLPPGLSEKVVCDGKSILHLYPQLGLGAKRTVSRFHRAGISAMLPWVAPPAADLAKGAVVKLYALKTVDIIPHGAGKKIKDKDGKEIDAPTYRLRLIFGNNNLVWKRQIVEMPKDKVLLEQVCFADGVVQWFDTDNKQLSLAKNKLAPTEKAPNLSPATKDLIVLDLPYRTPEHVRATLKIQDKNHGQLTFAQATALFAAYIAAGNGGEARNVFQQALHNRNERQLGYYVLLAAAGQNLDAQNINVLDDHPESPLAQYLALHSSPTLRQHASQWAIGSVQWQDPLLKHLATTHALYQRWQSKQVEKWTPDRLQKERETALKYVKDNKDSAFGWVMLTLLQNKTDADKPQHKAFFAELADHWALFQAKGASSNGAFHAPYAARYEEARCLLFAGKGDVAREKFVKLYTDTLKDGYLPAIDGDFRAALLSSKDAAAWGALLQTTAKKLIEDKKRPAILALAWQCWQLDDGPQANQLLTVAMSGIKYDAERDSMKLAGVLFYQQTKQFPQADLLLTKLLDDPTQAERPELWRLASKIAAQRNLTAKSLSHLEKALDLEFKKLPDIINLQQVREDYGTLLDHYKNMADALVALKVDPPEDFLPRMIKMADRWRSLDPKSAVTCNTTADILMTLGYKDLGWDYLTTPIALQPNDSGPWANLAENLRKGGDLTLADLAFKAATEAEPTNAQLLWDRADNLHQSGKTVQAETLFRQIADGQWGPQYAGLVAQAKLRVTQK